MKQGLVSIIMPTYGVEKYISNAIESVISQTYANWELIVVNDGSPDRSREFALDFAAGDARIRVVDKPNGGLSDARNYGLQFAAGEFVHFFDSDDSIQPDFYETYISAFSKDTDFVIGGYTKRSVGSNAGSPVSSQSFLPPEHLQAGTLEWTKQTFSVITYAWNKVYRHNFLLGNKLLFTKGLSLIEDIEFISRVLQCKPEIKYIQYSGYNYYIRPRVTLSRDFSAKMVELEQRRVNLASLVASSINIPGNVANQYLQQLQFSCLLGILFTLFRFSSPKSLKEYCRILHGIRTSQLGESIAAGARPTRKYDKVIFHLFLKRKFLTIAIIYRLRNLIS